MRHARARTVAPAASHAKLLIQIDERSMEAILPKRNSREMGCMHLTLAGDIQ